MIGNNLLFYEKERQDIRPKAFIEGEYHYLDRSGRPECANIRNIMNRWISKYPDEHRSELICRLSSGDERQFAAASFELLLFACIYSLGYKVQVHPSLPNGSPKRPDFLVRDLNGNLFFLEAVLASEGGRRLVSIQMIKNAVLHSIEKIDSPNFFLCINESGNPAKSPRTGQLRRKLEEWLKGLNPDLVADNYEKDIPFPIFSWEEDGWLIKFEAVPKKPNARGKGQQVIGAQMEDVKALNIWESLRDVIKGKGRDYGQLPQPLLVAANVDTNPIDRIDEVQALFGQEEFVFPINSSDTPFRPVMRRRPNGLWNGPKGEQYTRVSGVWIFNMVNFWNASFRNATLYYNPWAEHDLAEDLSLLDHAKLVGHEIKWFKGKSPRELLELPAGWPAS